MRKQNRGFTLIEVLISIIILAATSLTLFGTWSGATGALRKSRVYNNVYLLLQKKAAEFEAQNREKPIEQIKDEDGDFGKEYPEYTWEIKTKAFELPISFPKNPNANNEMMDVLSRTLTTYFEQAVKEVSIIVIYKKNGKSIRHSVTTLFIDYTKEIPIPGGI